MSTTIKPIHPFGPAVGKWRSHGTVADTIARERRRLKEQRDREQENKAEVARVVTPLKKDRT